MKINKLDASFGKLQNESLKFHEGLNIVTDPDSGRRDSWCAFIRCMLYGVDGTAQISGDKLPDRILYAPESGGLMEGSMDISVNDYNMSLSRRSRAKNAAMREFSAVYTGKNRKVEELNSMNSGKMLTGLSEDAFSRCCYINESGDRPENNIKSILSTGESGCSLNSASAGLDSRLQKLRHENSGTIPELKAKISDTEIKLEEMNGALDELESLEEKLQSSSLECQRLEEAVTESRKMQRKNSLSRLSSGRTELKEKSLAHDRAMDSLSQKREALRESRFGEISAQELEEQMNSDVERYNSLASSSPSLIVALPAIICFVLAVVFAALYTSKGGILFIIVSALLCLAAVILLLRFSKLKQQSAGNQDEQRKILKKYKAADTGEIFEALDAHYALCNALMEAEALEQQTRNEYEDAKAQQTELESEALSDLDFASGSSDAARYSRELSKSRTEAQEISYEISDLRRRLAAMGDPLVLASSLSCLKADYEKLTKEYEALSLAGSVLNEAGKEMQSRISPEIGKLASKYMSSLTGNKYDDLLLDADFSPEKAQSIDSDYLSHEALELIDFSLRLAVSQLAMAENETCPLIINEALTDLSEESYSLVLEFLMKLSKKRQIIIFTSREYMAK